MGCLHCFDSGIVHRHPIVAKCFHCLKRLEYTQAQIRMMTNDTAATIVAHQIDNRGISITKDGELLFIGREPPPALVKSRKAPPPPRVPQRKAPPPPRGAGNQRRPAPPPRRR